MGKGELWDDSALVNAFDEAISKYKKMHGKGCKETSNGVARDVKSSTGDSLVAVDATQDGGSPVEAVDGGNSAFDAAAEVGEVEILETSKGNEVADSQVSEEHAFGSHTLPSKDQSHQAQNHSSSVIVDEYNELYKQYYEVEEQRQKILQRLQEFSGWTYNDAGEVSVSGLQWGTNSATQGYQPSTSHVPCAAMVVSCCPCTCPCSMASCTSPGVCGGIPSSNSPAARVPKNLPEDVDMVKMAMGAAERAITSLKDPTSDRKDDNKICSGMEGTGSSGTDLGTVLNSWYSAGFYTGKRRANT